MQKIAELKKCEVPKVSKVVEFYLFLKQTERSDTLTLGTSNFSSL